MMGKRRNASEALVSVVLFLLQPAVVVALGRESS